MQKLFFIAGVSNIWKCHKTKKSDDKDYFFVNCNAIIFNERPRCPLTYAVIAVNNVEDFVAGFFITEIVGTDAAEDGRLSQSLPGSVAGLSAMLDHVSIRANIILSV